jgi:DNA-binding NtrC family response regulator
MPKRPDPALQDLANVAAASEALARLTQMGGPLWGTAAAGQIKQLLPRLARKAVATAATFLPPPPVSPPAPALDPLLERVAALSLREARAIFEGAYLAAQVVRHKGNVTAAAVAAGMERSALHRKLALLGVEVRREPGRIRRKTQQFPAGRTDA